MVPIAGINDGIKKGIEYNSVILVERHSQLERTVSSNYGARLGNEVSQGVDKQQNRRIAKKKNMRKHQHLRDRELHKGMDQEKSESSKKAMRQNSRTFSKESRIRDIKKMSEFV